MTYLLLAILGAAAGWYLVRFAGFKMNQYYAMGIGALGGLAGALLGTLFAFAAVILFKVILAVLGAYALIKLAQKYLKVD